MWRAIQLKILPEKKNKTMKEVKEKSLITSLFTHMLETFLLMEPFLLSLWTYF